MTPEQRPEPPNPQPGLRVAQARSGRSHLVVELDTLEAQRAEAARSNAVLADERAELEASLGELEEVRTGLERALAEAQLAAEQARVGRDRAQTELQTTKNELQQARAQLEAARERERPADAAEGAGSRKARSRRAEKRIAELEGELETERELRQDFEVALELLQRQQAEDAGVVGNDRDPAGETSAAQEPQRATAREPASAGPEPTDGDPGGWGVPLEAFPVDPEPPEHADQGLGPRGRLGRRSRSRPGGRSDP